MRRIYIEDRKVGGIYDGSDYAVVAEYVHG